MTGRGHGNPLQYSCLENPMDRGAWRATVHGVAKSQDWVTKPISLTLLLLLLLSRFSRVRLYLKVNEPRGIPSVVFQSLSHIQLFGTPWTAASQVHLSHHYMTTGKTIALTIWTVGGVCNFLGSVLLQQKIEAKDKSVLQLSFIWQAKENTSLRHEGGLTQKTRREERPPGQFWLLFLYVFFSFPRACPV